mgnify:CR=1 FL=1
MVAKRTGIMISALVFVAADTGAAIDGVVTIPVITGRPGMQPFAGHPGFVDAFGRDGARYSARIGMDARFSLPDVVGPVTVIATFDGIETPPTILSPWPSRSGDGSLPLMGIEYACVPPGYYEAWDRDYKVRAHEYWQTFVARSRNLYGIMMYDGPKITWWGNKVNVAVYRGGPGGSRIDFPAPWGTGPNDNASAHHTDRGFPRVGWRHGDIGLTPGDKYAVRVCGYKSHGQQLFDLDAFIRPDTGDGYIPGEAYHHNGRAGGDLCMMLFGSLHGQIIENHVRSEEWNIFIVKRPPTRRWGQSFVAHGVSAAGVRFWGSDGVHDAAATDSRDGLTCTVRIREHGPKGRVVGPARTTRAHNTSTQEVIRVTGEAGTGTDAPGGRGAPVVRYPETPGPLPGHERYYRCPFDMFQVAWAPDEVRLSPGTTYYLELEASRPLMMFADGDALAGGFGFYEGTKVEAEPNLMHGDPRWTLLMDIVTYENPGGVPESLPAPATRAAPGPDDNLLLNGGAETGDFTGWHVCGDPMIDPSTHVPVPANHGGRHRFGVSVGWAEANVCQYQEVPAVIPGARYVAGMWVCHMDGTDEAARLLWCDGPFGGPEQALAETAVGPEPAWTRLEGRPFTPTGPTFTLIVRYRHAKPTNIASIHVDDVYLKREVAASAP